MKFKVGDKVRVKTEEELIRDSVDWDWDEPYAFSRGKKGTIYRYWGNNNKANYNYPVFIKFDDGELEPLDSCDIAEVEETGYKEEEVIFLYRPSSGFDVE